MSPQRETFARHLASGMSQSEALRKCNIKAAHWKAAAVHQTASRWAADAQVQARVAELQQQLGEQAVLRAADALREIARIALFDPRGIVDDKGRLKLLHELDDKTASGVAAFEISDTGGIKYKFHDKNAALEKACRILGLYERDNQQKTDPLTELLKSLSGNVLGVVANPEPEEAGD